MKKSKKEDLIIIGGGEHAGVLIDAALASKNWNIVGFIDKEKSPKFSASHNIMQLGSDNNFLQILKKYKNAKYILGMGGNGKNREKISKRFDLPPGKWATIIHPSAIISPKTKIAHGVAILCRAVVQTGAVIEEHAIINNGSVIEHDVSIGKHTHIAPGVITGGGCRIGSFCFIGLGSRIKDHITVEDSVTVGSGSVVVTNIPKNETVTGVPAKRLSKESYKNNMQIEDICISPNTTLYEALSTFDKAGSMILLITKPDRKLMGILAYGDFRHALLDHNDLNQPVKKFMNTNFKYVKNTVSRVTAIEQMKAFGISRMPILDETDRVVGLHLQDGSIGTLNLDNPVVIMAGGEGKRLRPITNTLPKPMVKVAGRPILEHIIYHLAGSGISSIYIAVNYLSEIIEDYFKDGASFGCKIEYLKEPLPLGTAGPLSLLPKQKSPVIVINGDLITHFNVENMLHEHKIKGNQITIGVNYYKLTIPYGVIDVENSDVVSITEKPDKHFLVNGGVYVIDQSLIKMIPKNSAYQMTDFINEILSSNKKIGAYLLEGDWIDVGHHKDLACARGNI